MTESMISGIFTPINGTYKPGSVGVPLPDVEVRILDADDGHTPLAAGQVGEIVVRAPQLMSGYWQRPDETAQMLRDGWLFSGDLGLPGRGRLPVHRRPQEGSDQAQRLSGLAARGRRGDRHAPGRGRSRRRRHPRSPVQRGGESLGGAAPGPARHGSRDPGLLPGGWWSTRSRSRSSSATACRKVICSSCCAANWPGRRGRPRRRAPRDGHRLKQSGSLASAESRLRLRSWRHRAGLRPGFALSRPPDPVEDGSADPSLLSLGRISYK